MEWLEILIYVLGSILCIAGIIGCLLPVIPGPPFNFSALLLLYFFTENNFTVGFIIFWLVVSVLVTVLDYWVPILGSRKMGGSTYGVWGSAIGMVAGILFFPPLGLILGPIAGAWVGELISGKTGAESLKAAFGSFLGFLAGTFLKLIASSVMTFYFVLEIFGL